MGAIHLNKASNSYCQTQIRSCKSRRGQCRCRFTAAQSDTGAFARCNLKHRSLHTYIQSRRNSKYMPIQSNVDEGAGATRSTGQCNIQGSASASAGALQTQVREHKVCKVRFARCRFTADAGWAVQCIHAGWAVQMQICNCVELVQTQIQLGGHS